MKEPLKKIIAQYMSSADLSEHQFMRLWQMGRRGCIELNLGAYSSFKSVLLEVNANMTCDLPTDYIQYSKIGILNSVGEVATLKRNDSLSPLHSQYIADRQAVVDVPTIDSNILSFSPSAIPNIWYNFGGFGGYGYHLYGLSGGTSTIGEYRVSDDDKLIYLSADWPYGSLMMEYLSDGYDCESEDYMVDIRAAECLISYIRWQDSIDSRKKFNSSDVRYRMQEFYRNKKIATRRINSSTISELQDVFRTSVKLVAKA